MNVNVFGGPDLVIGFTKMAPAEQSTGSCRNRGFPALLGGFFSKRLAEASDDRIEWSPLRTEAENFLRYSADFFEKAKNVTHVHFSQLVELRRRSARDLHLLAGLAGESLISSEMNKRIADMI